MENMVAAAVIMIGVSFLVTGIPLQAAGLKTPTLDPVFGEQSLSVHLGSEPHLPGQDVGPGLRFTHGGHTLLAASAQGTPVSDEQAALYVRFLRYRLGGHPEILRQLRASRQIPKHLEFGSFEGNEWAITRLDLLKLQTAAEVPKVPVGLKTSAFSSQAVDQLMIKALVLTDQQQHSLKIKAQAAEMMKQNNILAAALLYLGDSLSSGTPLDPAFAREKNRIQADPQAIALFQSLSGNSEEASRNLTALESPAGGGVNVLYIFEGGVLSARGDAKNARERYTRALQGDPHITGAWKDLGSNYFEGFDSMRAWRCWDVARHLCPGYPQLQAVIELEEQIVHDCPDYF